MHKVLDFDHYEVSPPSASSHRVNLVKSEKDSTVIEKDLSLQELYDKYLSPGKFLYLADEIPKKLDGKYEILRNENIPAERNNYAIAKKHTMEKVSTKGAQTDRKQLGPLKNVIMLLSNPIEYTKLVLDRAYQFIELGSPVEVRIRLFGSAVAAKNKGKTPDPAAVPWLHDHFPHLRPDFILKSMPEGTEYLIKPVSDGRVIQFVLGRQAEQMSKLNFTTRLFRVKAAVEASLPNNPMAQRYQHNKQKKKGGKIREGGAPARKMNDSEIAQQKQILADAASGARGRLDLSEARTPFEGTGDRDEDMEESVDLGLRLNQTGAKQKKPWAGMRHGEGKAIKSKQRNTWEGRGTKK